MFVRACMCPSVRVSFIRPIASFSGVMVVVPDSIFFSSIDMGVEGGRVVLVSSWQLGRGFVGFLLSLSSFLIVCSSVALEIAGEGGRACTTHINCF